jgi:hypothetical protein
MGEDGSPSAIASPLIKNPYSLAFDVITTVVPDYL